LFIPTGRVTRTEWRLRKHQEDLGDFAAAIDELMENKDSMTMDTFFSVVAKWAGVSDVGQDVDPETTSDSSSVVASSASNHHTPQESSKSGE